MDFFALLESSYTADDTVGNYSITLTFPRTGIPRGNKRFELRFPLRTQTE